MPAAQHLRAVVNVAPAAPLATASSLTLNLRGPCASSGQVCVVDKPSGPGEWIQRTDLISDGDKLVLYDTGAFGHCDRECRTIEHACEEVVEGADTAFSEALYQGVKEGMDLEKVQRLVCNRAAKVCKAKPPPLKADRVDYPFREMTADEKHMADMCAPRLSPRRGPCPCPTSAKRGGRCAKMRRNAPSKGALAHTCAPHLRLY